MYLYAGTSTTCISDDAGLPFPTFHGCSWLSEVALPHHGFAFTGPKMFLLPNVQQTSTLQSAMQKEVYIELYMNLCAEGRTDWDRGVGIHTV